MIKSKSMKILSALSLMFALPVATLTGTNSQHVHDETSENSYIVSNKENNYSSIEEYQAINKQSNVSTLADVHDHSDTNTWTPVSSGTQTLSNGNYYLTGDTTGDITLSNATLCLNGQVLTGTGSGAVITIAANTSYNYINDCQDGSAEHTLTDDSNNTYTFTSGVITGGYIDSLNGNGGGVYINSGSFLEMTAGTIALNTGIFSGGVYIPSSATFRMNGGTISNNTSYGAGGVYAGGGVFAMSGGTISNNSGLSSGGVYIDNGGNVQMTGGTIEYNEGNPGAVQVNNGSFLMSAGTIANNKAYGSVTGNSVIDGIYVGTSGTLTITGGFYNGEFYTENTSNAIIQGGYYGADAFQYNASITRNEGIYYLVYSGYTSLITNEYSNFPYVVIPQQSHIDHDNIEFSTMFDGFRPTYTSGTTYLYLAVNMKLSTNITISSSATVYLCLHGKVLDGNSNDGATINVDGGTLYLYDCQEGLVENTVTGRDNNSSTYDSGVIMGGYSRPVTITYGGGLLLENSANFTMYGGTIAHNYNANYNYYGDGLTVIDSTFTMYGGKIVNNTSSYSVSVGLYSSTCYVYGGYIDGRFYLSSSNLYLTGGYLSESAYTDSNLTWSNYLKDANDSSAQFEILDLSQVEGAYGDTDYDSNFPYAVYSLSTTPLDAEFPTSIIVPCSDDVEDYIPSSSDYSIEFTYTHNGTTYYEFPTETGSTYYVTATLTSISGSSKTISRQVETIIVTIRNHINTYVYEYDEDSHWYVCDYLCGTHLEETSHSLTTDEDGSTSCVCGYTLNSSTSDPSDPSDPSDTSDPSDNTSTDSDLTWLIVITSLGGFVLLLAIALLILVLIRRRKLEKNK